MTLPPEYKGCKTPAEIAERMSQLATHNPNLSGELLAKADELVLNRKLIAAGVITYEELYDRTSERMQALELIIKSSAQAMSGDGVRAQSIIKDFVTQDPSTLH